MGEGYGYNHNENDGKKGCTNLTQKEKAMVIRVNSVWREKKDVAWSRWEKRK